jgi:tripeptide aminopeptidase
MAIPTVTLDHLSDLPKYTGTIAELRDVLITNILMIGQEDDRVQVLKEDDDSVAARSPKASMFGERLSMLRSVDECTIDADGNPVALIKGKDPGKKPIIIGAHLDIVLTDIDDLDLSVTEQIISGPGVADNSVAVGTLATLPDILSELSIELESDLYIVGFQESLGRSNLKSVRSFLENWKKDARGAVMIEGIELGRLNYFTLGMIRGEVQCQIPEVTGWENKGETNAILILNEVINRIMAISLPQRPRSRINIGRINAGMKFGEIALTGRLGFEVMSDSFQMVEQIYKEIHDIVESLAYENQVDMTIDKLSDVGSYSLGYNHPLVKSAIAVMEALKIKPKINFSESELAIFLARNIPTITLGLTHGENIHKENAVVDINTLFTGIAQLVGIIQAIDEGVCDG